ncbi:WD40-repeat-containing domain protein [Terfezia claveryi]|nr:WD40-repeat-containing domain protein [Terfezia claveryi]
MRQENGNTSSQSAIPNTIGGIRNGATRNGVSKANGNSTDSSGRNGFVKQEGDSAASSFAMLSSPVPTSDYFGHDREEVTRILMQSLWDLGYSRAAMQLEEDSEYTLEAPEVSHFRQAVLKGEWNKAEKLLFSLDIDKDADTNALLFYMRQQKFLELLEVKDITKALSVLRTELTPLNQNEDKLHSLASLMMCVGPEDLRKNAGWDGAEGLSRQQLLSELSKSITPSTMIPEHRLASLLHQVKQAQISKCLYHNTANSPSLYSDHSCPRDQFPLATIEILTDHSDEVWFLQFSHDGTRLASASQDSSVIVWDTQTWEPIHTLREHPSAVTYVQWSPDDLKLLTATAEKKAMIWDSHSGQCILTIDAHKMRVICCAWAPDGQSFVTGSDDKDLTVWNLQGTELHKWSGSRIYDLAITPDGKRLVAIDADKMVHVYNFITRELEYECNLGSDITSVAVSRDSKYMIINMAAAQEVHLYDIETTRLIQRYAGQKQKEFVIRSCFGGADENLVLSGSEDSLVYVWQRENGNLVEKLPGHSGTVNCVAWNPKDPHVFASAGDDRLIRIWSKASQSQSKGKVKDTDGVF